jgi:hypothetical protein
MAWLGTVLASHRYIVAPVNHPGNNGYDRYTPQGFSTSWERARDLSTVIDKMLVDSVFCARIDPRRMGAAGSLGGYTTIEIASGITNPAAFKAFCNSPGADSICKSPPEFPDLVGQYDRLSRTDPDFQQALAHAGDSYRDEHIRAVFAMAPALGPAFAAAALTGSRFRSRSWPAPTIKMFRLRPTPPVLRRAYSGSKAHHPARGCWPLRLLGYMHGSGPQIFADPLRRCTRSRRDSCQSVEPRRWFFAENLK